MPAYTALIVEDFKEFAKLILLTLQEKPEFEIYQASDGLEGVQRAEELQPDLILLDIGLPKLNGIEAARRIRTVSPNSKILVLTQESSPEVLQAALNTGAHGYMLKVNMADELLLAVDAVLQGKQFVGAGLRPPAGLKSDDQRSAVSFPSLKSQIPHSQAGHVVASYRTEVSLVDDFVRFIETALSAGNPVIVIATESHRHSIQQQLRARGSDIVSAIQDGRYISLDAHDALSIFMVNDWPESDRLLKSLRDLVSKAMQVAKCENPRVAACGEMGPLLLARSHGQAAVQLEHLTHQIASTCAVDILCGYMQDDIETQHNTEIFERICAQHSAAYSL
jgi:DNA-binding NarL/FixJ family response regulator